MTPKEWAACVVVLRSSYGASFKLDEEGVAVWYEMLADLPGNDVQAAVAYMVKSQRAFPSIADIRAIAEPPAPDAGEAWAKACRWVSETSCGPLYVGGIEQERESVDEAIAGAIEAVGFDVIRNRTTDDERALRAHFGRYYESRLKRQRLQQAGLGSPMVIGPINLASLPIGRPMPEVPRG